MARSVKPAQDETTRDRTYFCDDHLRGGFQPISSVWKQVVDGKVYVGYKFFKGERHKAPRKLTLWLDKHFDNPHFIQREIEGWKDRCVASKKLPGLFAGKFTGPDRQFGGRV